MKDAEGGDAYACLGVAYMYHHGKGLEYDLNEAIKWYVRAVDAGCTRAQWEIAKMYRDGIIFDRDIDESMKHLHNAADMGNPEAQLTLALEYVHGVLIERDLEKAFRYMATSARQGVPMAQFYLGYMYRNAMGIDGSRTEAELWYSSATISGNADMFMQIGLMYEFGLDRITHNEVEAAKWYQYGAERGHEGCLFSLNKVKLNLKNKVKETYEERIQQLKNINSVKEREARQLAFDIANNFFDNGDFKNSFIHFEKAADLGNSDAMFFLSLMYRDGMHVRRNMRRSLELLARAADAGSADGQFMLARLYDVGGGLAESEIDSIKYYTMAAAGGYLSAFYYLGQYMDHPEIHVRRSIGKYR